MEHKPGMTAGEHGNKEKAAESTEEELSEGRGLLTRFL